MSARAQSAQHLNTPVQRRSLLKGAAAVAALGVVPGVAACGSGGGGGTGTGQTVGLGSNYSDEVPKAAMQAVVDGFTTKTKTEVKVNTVDHNTFQEQINNYLQGRPDDVLTWFAGFRMRFFARKGLVGDISDVWEKIGDGFSDAMKEASTGDDGKQYFVPMYNYPWAVFYRRSVFEQRGYQPPRTLDDLKALGAKMQKDGLVPIAFADKDGWPAMGTFDYLNMRINGYEFHIKLMAGEGSWDSKEVKTVFDTWKGLLPLHQTGSLGRTWQEAAQALLQKKAGMYLLGSFVGEQFPAGPDREDLDFFPFPEVDPNVGTDAVEAPIDGFMMARRPKNEKGAKEFLSYLGTPEAENTFLKTSPNNVAVHEDADTSAYTPLQKKAAELIGGAKSISQFLDRDANPTFASTVMIPALQKFIQNPNDIDGLTKSIEQQKKTIYTD